MRIRKAIAAIAICILPVPPVVDNLNVPFYGDVYTVVGNTIVDSDGNVTERITEDDPRWDCATMGNLICGNA